MARARTALATGGGCSRSQRVLAARADLSAAAYMQAPPGVGREGRGRVRGRVEAHGRRPRRPARDGPRPAPSTASAPPPCARSARPRCRRRGSSTTRASSTAGTRCRSPASSTWGRPAPPARRSTSAARSPRPAGEPAPAGPLALRPEIEALEGELLAAYRPPALDRPPPRLHRRELRAQGGPRARRGRASSTARSCATCRPSQRFAPLRAAAGRPTRPARGRRLRELEARLSGGGRRPQPRAGSSSSARRRRSAASPPGDGGRAGDRRRRRCPATSRPSSPRAPGAAAARAARHGHARPLAVHLKPLRSGRSAGPERRAGERRPASSSRTTATRRSRSASASRATR